MNAFTQPGDVVEITVLKSQPDSDKALEILRKIASKVKPIMKKHGWVLPTLAEFFPKNPNLLGININRGKKICIRLRPASDPYSFLPLEEELIGTMLHELTHNHRGPHDESFNKFLDGLWNEYDALSARGYTGEGFLGVGRRVGEGIGHDSGLSLREAREKALRNFEEKERVRKVLGVGGRLGGKEVETKGRRLGDILADAAERRSKATKGCGGDDAHDHASGSAQTDLPQEVQDEIEKADKDSRRVVIDLTQDEDSDGETDEEEFGNEELPTRRKGDSREFEEDRKPDLREESPDLIIVSDSSTSASFKPPPPRTSSRTGQKRSGQTSPPTSKRRSIPSSSSSSQQPQRGWTCPLCTYHNLSSTHLSCSICLSERPASTLPSSSSSSKRPPSSLPETMTLKSITGTKKEVVMKSRKEEEERWTCHVCAKRVEKVFWCCTDCGTVKLRS